MSNLTVSLISKCLVPIQSIQNPTKWAIDLCRRCLICSNSFACKKEIILLKSYSPIIARQFRHYSHVSKEPKKPFLRLKSKVNSLTRTQLAAANQKDMEGDSDKAEVDSAVPATGTSSMAEPQVSLDDDDMNPLLGMADLTFSSLDSEDENESDPYTDYAYLKRLKESDKIVKYINELERKGLVPNTPFKFTILDYPSRTAVPPCPFKPKVIRSRNLTDATAVFQCNAWDDVEWDEEQKSKAVEIVSGQLKSKMDEERKDKLENEADKYWDDFYKNHKNKFFRDRNWLFSEFPELESPHGSSIDPDLASEWLLELRQNESFPGENSKFKVLEVGCGVGNTVFPLLSLNNHPHTYVYCCDFSSEAISIVKQQAIFNPQRCTPFVLDITEENPNIPFPENSIDVLTAIFVVSAISPAKFQQAIKNFHRFLKPGGLVLFRDYGRYDMAQLRFKDGRCIDENFYVRGDGTRVYFFTEEEVEAMFTSEGFEKHSMLVDRRLQVNRGKQLKMYRVWVQAKFRKL